MGGARATQVIIGLAAAWLRGGRRLHLCHRARRPRQSHPRLYVTTPIAYMSMPVTNRNMDVFSLRDTVVSQYRSFMRSTMTIGTANIPEQVDTVYAEDRYWPEPLVQINPRYKSDTDVAELVAQRMLNPRCAEVIRRPPPASPAIAHPPRGGSPS